MLPSAWFTAVRRENAAVMRVGGGIMLACVALACAVGARPDWLDGRHPEYPRERYLVGVGDAEALDGARDRARAEIARVFEVRRRPR